MRTCRICSVPYAAGEYSTHKQSHSPTLYARSAVRRRVGEGQRGRRVDRARRERLRRQIALGLTLQQVADLEGCSRQNVSQIVGGAFAVRDRLGPRAPIDRSTRAIRRFWARVNVDPSGCWLWTGVVSPGGYGRANGNQYAHRAAYIAVKGSIPDGLGLDHLCRVRSCVNPDHLEPVTTRENIMRSPIQVAALNARKTHCKRGHEFTQENTERHGNGRACRTCRRGRTAEQIAAKREYDRLRHGRARTVAA